MVQISIQEEFAGTMLDLKAFIGVFNKHADIFSPYKGYLLQHWSQLYKRQFKDRGMLKGKKREEIFKRWLALFFEGLRMKDLTSHYKDMVEFGRELTDMGISLEELILSLHFFEEVSMPLLMKHYPDKDKLAKMLFALDMLFHNELACLSMAYFYRYRSEIARLEKMKEDLTHMIVHDLKSPVNVISVAIDILLGGIGQTGQVNDSEYLKLIASASKNMRQMLNNLLDIHKMEKGEFVLDKSYGDINEVTQDVIESIRPKLDDKKIKVLFRKEEIAPFFFDKGVIKRVIDNLLDNAIKFSSSGSSVIISSKAKDGKVFLSVKNRGPVIKKEYREKIFEKFGQARLASKGKKYGTGLGLAFCKMAVDASGGEIKVLSGKTGTTFVFSLPA